MCMKSHIRQSLIWDYMGDGAEEIERLIHATFTNSLTQGLSEQELARMWALDLHWISPDSASEIIETLCQTGWLIRSEGLITPDPRIGSSPPPLGWSPMVRRLMNPPSFTPNHIQIDTSRSKTKINEPKIELSSSQDYPPDWAEASIKPIISWISKESGLTQKEVVRRAQRKRRALGPVTLWFSLSLVAREQGLDMDKIIELIGEPN